MAEPLTTTVHAEVPSRLLTKVQALVDAGWSRSLDDETAEALGVSTAGYIAILVIVSGVFAWLVKRMSDTVSGLSSYWFSEESDEPD